jgi:hypothetical protein
MGVLVFDVVFAMAVLSSLPESTDVLRLTALGYPPLIELLTPFGLQVKPVAEAAPIPGTFWGEPEAGLVGQRVYARPDTPIHSVLHEAGHAICMDPERRAGLDTQAGGDPIEEVAVCYLQVLLADALTGYDRERLFDDMDRWGYTFRFGHSRAWFARDAADARAFLVDHGVIDAQDRLHWRCRGA